MNSSTGKRKTICIFGVNCPFKTKGLGIIALSDHNRMLRSYTLITHWPGTCMSEKPTPENMANLTGVWPLLNQERASPGLKTCWQQDVLRRRTDNMAVDTQSVSFCWEWWHDGLYDESKWSQALFRTSAIWASYSSRGSDPWWSGELLIVQLLSVAVWQMSFNIGELFDQLVMGELLVHPLRYYNFLP